MAKSKHKWAYETTEEDLVSVWTCVDCGCSKRTRQAKNGLNIREFEVNGLATEEEPECIDFRNLDEPEIKDKKNGKNHTVKAKR